MIQSSNPSESLQRDIADVKAALARAAQHARERARQRGTKLVISDNGHVRYLDPKDENGSAPADAEPGASSESVDRESDI
jgi:hypothetical protein